MKRRDPVNTLTPEGKYKIKVLSVHAKPVNDYGIRSTTVPEGQPIPIDEEQITKAQTEEARLATGLAEEQAKRIQTINTGGKKKTRKSRKTRKNNKRYTRRNKK